MPSRPNDPTGRLTPADFPHRPTNKLRVRRYPPTDSCEGDVAQWKWRTASPVYRRRIKRAVQLVQAYRLSTTGCDHLNRDEKDAIHRLLDTNVPDSRR